MSDQHDKLQAAATLVRKSVQFAVWAAGEGICPADGEPAEAPDDFVMDYTNATDDADWETLADRLIERIRAAEAKAGEPVGWVRCDLPAAVKQHRGVSDYILDERVHDDDVALYAAPVDTAALAERVKTLEEALQRIASFNDKFAERKLIETGSYSYFDEPVSVSIARKALGGGNE